VIGKPLKKNFKTTGKKQWGGGASVDREGHTVGGGATKTAADFEN